MDDYCISFLIATVLFAFFTGEEAAFSATGKLRLETEEDATESKSNIEKLMAHLYRHSGRFLSAILTGRVIMLTIAVSSAFCTRPLFAGSFLKTPIEELVFQIIITAFIIWTGGILLPRFLFLLSPVRTFRFFVYPVYFIYKLINPLTSFLSAFVKDILKLFGIEIKKEDSERAFTRGELDSLITKSINQEKEGTKVNEEVKIFQNALDFSTIRIRDCMVPRTEIKGIDIHEAEASDLKSLFIETGHSKIIIYDNDIDHIIGYLHSSEMFTHPDSWKEHIREIPIIPETMAAQKLLQLFMVQKKSLAVVVDEFGGTSGIVSLEDLVEEIFGDIEDEHDTNTYTAKQISADEYILSARLEIEKINEMFDLNLPESNDYQTLGGLILSLYQNFPKLNEEIRWNNIIFKVVKKTTTKIELVKVKVEKEEHSEEEE